MATTARLADLPPIYARGVRPSTKPLPVWRFLPTFLLNPLRTLPEAVYHEPIFAPPSMKGRVAWVCDPAMVERILLGEHEAFPKSPLEDRIFASILGAGILTAEGQAWRWQRRTVAPLFRHIELTSFVPAMSAAGARKIARWQSAGDLARRRVDTDMTDATFDVLASTIFSGATDAEGAALKHHGGAYLENTSWDTAFELLQVPRWVWHPAKPAIRRHARALHTTIATVLERERARGFPGGGLIAKLAAARDPETGAPMSDALICQNLLTFAAAGHETTAKALTWTLYLLARSPHWQDRIANEVTGIAGEGPITDQHLEQLVITRQVLKEGMRLYPPAPVMGRMATSNIEIGGHTFKPGAMLVIPIYAIQRHRLLWRDPDLFDPTRFAPEVESSIKRTQFMPFGFGPRTCIGLSFAMMEAQVLLAEFVRAFRFTWTGGTREPEPVSRVTLRPRGGMSLHLERRTG